MPVTRGPSFDARPPDCAFPTRLSDNRPQPLVTQHLEPIPNSRVSFLFIGLSHRSRSIVFPDLGCRRNFGRRRQRCCSLPRATYEGNSVGRLFSISESERAITEDEAPFRFPYVAHSSSSSSSFFSVFYFRPPPFWEKRHLFNARLFMSA